MLFQNRMISVPFELEQAEFGILILGIPLPEKSQKECGLIWLSLDLKSHILSEDSHIDFDTLNVNLTF